MTDASREDPREEWVPSQEYREELYLKGYQGARMGLANPYEAGSMNADLWNNGAEAFYDGKPLFG